MATIVLCHGAWSAAWAWRRMRAPLATAGHEVFWPSYAGLGARHHLAHPGIYLETHVADIAGVIAAEELADVVLLGHSYGGMVATVVASRLRDRIARVIYLDAFVPRDGQSLFDLVGPEQRARMEHGAAQTGEGWRVPPNPPPPDTTPEDAAWVARRRCDMPIGCLRQPARIEAEPECPRHYILATRRLPGAPFDRFAARARSEAGWSADEIDASHSPAITAPGLLAAALERALSPR